MKLFLILGFLTLISGGFAFSGIGRRSTPPESAANEAAENFAAVKKQPVLVELFTSEGCLSCPPADKVLAQLDESENPNADVITLSLHVDYWDSPGWRDPFSSLAFSRRQDIYSAQFRGENYTPQMIIDGREAFVGSDAGRAQKAIANAAKTPKANVELTQILDKIKVKITDAPAHENANVFLAIAENDLALSVRGGENSGRRLAHASVVRELKPIAILPAEQKNLETETTVEVKPEWKKENLRLVVFLQENRARKIFGAGKIKFND